MHRKDVIPTTITSASLPAKKRILTVCVKLFLEQGYKKTTVSEIVHKASVSNSIFQNIFRAKDGVLTELVEFMFSNQFAMARTTAGAQLPPVYVYAVETAIQMTLTELNENLREIYIEALRFRACGIILLHNHPSGDPAPSREDCLFTERVREAGSLVGVPLLDHIIIGDNSYVSLRERGIFET